MSLKIQFFLEMLLSSLCFSVTWSHSHTQVLWGRALLKILSMLSNPCMYRLSWSLLQMFCDNSCKTSFKVSFCKRFVYLQGLWAQFIWAFHGWPEEQNQVCRINNCNNSEFAAWFLACKTHAELNCSTWKLWTYGLGVCEGHDLPDFLYQSCWIGSAPQHMKNNSINLCKL